MKKRRDLLPACLFLGPNFLGFCIFVAFPVVFSVMMAFTNWDLTLHNRFRPDEPIRWIWLSNFRELFASEDFWKFFGNTLFLMMGIPIGIAGSLLLAVLLTRQLRSRRVGSRASLAALSVIGFGAMGLYLSSSGYGVIALIISLLAGGVLALGFVTGSVAYRTLFYLPHFTSGVAVYLLWKQMYNPLRGPINAALQPQLNGLAYRVNRIPPTVGVIGMWALVAGMVLLVMLGLGRLRKFWREGDVSWLLAGVGVVLILLPVAGGFFWLPRTPDGSTQLVTIDGRRAVEFRDTTADRGLTSSFETRAGADSALVKRINEVLSQPLDVKKLYLKALAAAKVEQRKAFEANREPAHLSEDERQERFSSQWREWEAANSKAVRLKAIEDERQRLKKTFEIRFGLRRTAASSKPAPDGARMFLIFDPPDAEAGIPPFYGGHAHGLIELSKKKLYQQAASEWVKVAPSVEPEAWTFDVLPAREWHPKTGKPLGPSRRRIKDVRIRFTVTAGKERPKDPSPASASAPASAPAPPAAAETEAYAVADLTIHEAGDDGLLWGATFDGPTNPFTLQGRTHGVHWFLLAGVVAVILAAGWKCRGGAEFPCKLSEGLGSAVVLAMAVMIAQFILLGLAKVWFGLSEMALDGMLPPRWINSYNWAKPAIMIMGLWGAIGSNNMLLYIAGISNVPPQLYEAAEVDGAGGWARFWHVTWPQLAPTTFFIVIMAFIGGLQGGFEMARTMTGGGPFGATTTLSYYVYQQGFESLRFGYASAVAWVMFAMIFVMTVFNYRFGTRYINE